MIAGPIHESTFPTPARLADGLGLESGPAAERLHPWVVPGPSVEGFGALSIHLLRFYGCRCFGVNSASDVGPSETSIPRARFSACSFVLTLASTVVQNAQRFASIGISLTHSGQRFVVGSAGGSFRARARR